MKIAFATCGAQREGREDDHPAASQLGAAFEVWDDPQVDWGRYDRVVLRSVWDYTAHHQQFVQWCRAVGPERLRNQPALVEFNSDKLYLSELTVPTVSTTLLRPGDELPNFVGEVVVKPNVSAGGRDTGRFLPEAHGQAAALVEQIHASGRTALVQRYLESVDTAGETAVVIFGGQVSHVLHKKPVLRDPGVAPLAPTEHGPAAVMLEEDLVTASTATAEQLQLAAAAHAEISARFTEPLYLRVDMVWGPEGKPVVMELEAIEPHLYLSSAAGAAERFADAILHC